MRERGRGGREGGREGGGEERERERERNFISLLLKLTVFSLQSTDSNWAPCVVRETATLIYKVGVFVCIWPDKCLRLVRIVCLS